MATPLIGIDGNLAKVEGKVKLPITLGDIDGFIIKHVLVDSGSSSNVLTWEGNSYSKDSMLKLKKVATLVTKIGNKLAKVKGSVELLITLWDKIDS